MNYYGRYKIRLIKIILILPTNLNLKKKCANQINHQNLDKANFWKMKNNSKLLTVPKANIGN